MGAANLSKLQVSTRPYTQLDRSRSIFSFFFFLLYEYFNLSIKLFGNLNRFVLYNQ
jgi:hypothetical protein